jgi:hypothetical protein
MIRDSDCHGGCSLLADLTRQPQPRLDQHGQGHPYDAPLGSEAECIGLDVPQITELLDGYAWTTCL